MSLAIAIKKSGYVDKKGINTGLLHSFNKIFFFNSELLPHKIIDSVVNEKSNLFRVEVRLL